MLVGRGEHTELPPEPDSSSTTPCTDTGRTPRRARHRRRAGQRQSVAASLTDPHRLPSGAARRCRPTSRSARADLVALQRVERVATEPQPGTVREVEIHHVPPQRDRQLERRFLAPCARLDREAGLPRRTPCRRRATRSGIMPSCNACMYLDASDLEVVGAGDRKVDLGRAGESRGRSSPRSSTGTGAACCPNGASHRTAR